MQLSEILEKKFVSGVQYQKISYPKNGLADGLERKSCNSSDNLDTIPSPYLDHVFDNYIQACQMRRDGHFRAFLVSSRGCSFGCYYCFRSVKFEKVRYFSVKRFYDELEYLFNNFKVQRFFVLDDAFLYSKQRLKEFAEEFKKRA
jgi:anaerobic magnesium-protoporphyrin IX monomethyl ester cyclase